MASYKKSEISFETAKERTAGYPFALVYMMSEIQFGKKEDIEVNWDEVLEARFFSEREELHLFLCEKERKAVIVEDAVDETNSTEVLTKNYRLSPKFQGEGRELAVREYLSEDEDGQMYVELTRLCGIA
ncbi:MAG: hypothetical protein LUH14_10795 [Clostridiaceae bacterium]|nr:hypothetical protein [Clostridiaceae bacterium]